MGVKAISIKLERSSGVFYAGEVVRGTVELNVGGGGDGVTCRGFHVRLNGKAKVHWHTGSGDNRTDYYGETYFVSQRQTLLGNFYKTMLLDNAGKNAIFGKVYGDGIVHVPCRRDEEEQKLEMIVRVMDYDWGKRDDLLGELVVDVADIARSKQKKTFELTRFGKPEKGQVVLSAKFVPMEALFATPPSHSTSMLDQNYDTVCIVNVHEATGLRNAEILGGKNDVYVQLYRWDANSSRRFRNQLPRPDKNTTLPVGNHTFGFSFQIPITAPGSAEFPVSDYAYIRYSILANVDIKLFRDPSSKVVISVLPNRPAPLPALLCPAEREIRDEPYFGCEFCGLRCCKKTGLVTAVLEVGRRSYAPGELIDFRESHIVNDTGLVLPWSMELLTFIEMRSTFGSKRTRRRTNKIFSGTVAGNSTIKLSSLIPADRSVMPFVFPSFDGGVHEPNTRLRYQCLRWTYQLEITVGDQNSCASTPTVALPILIASAPPYAKAIKAARGSSDVNLSNYTASQENPFNVLDYGVFNQSSPINTIPFITGPEDGGVPTAATGLEMGVNAFELQEDQGNIGGTNLAYVPMVNAFNVSGGGIREPRIPKASATVLSNDKAVVKKVGVLVRKMEESYDKRLVVGEWARDNPREASSLSPKEVGRILSAVNFSLDQPSVASEIAANMQRSGALTCSHIAEAMEACRYQKTEIAKTMAPYASDPQNKGLVLGLIDFEFEKGDVEKLFRY